MPSIDLEDAVDLHGDTEGKCGGADGESGVLPGRFAEDDDHEIRRAIDDFRLIGEFRRGVDEAAKFDHLPDPI